MRGDNFLSNFLSWKQKQLTSPLTEAGQAAAQLGWEVGACPPRGRPQGEDWICSWREGPTACYCPEPSWLLAKKLT